MDDQPDSVLQNIILALDASIISAATNPSAAAVVELEEAGALCQTLRSVCFAADGCDASVKEKTVDHLWQIRSRIGRLKMLLDSADRFYRNLPTTAASDATGSGMDYNVLGEWKQPSSNAMVCVDC